MTVGEIAKNLPFSKVSLSDADRTVDGVYIGDLLSWVMGRAKSGNIWITIMSNKNVIAVATLADVSCVILAEGVQLDSDILAAAKAKGVNILFTDLTSYEIAAKIAKYLPV